MYNSDHFAYDFGSALAAAHTPTEVGTEGDDFKESAELYERKLLAGDPATPVTFGYGYATESEHGHVLRIEVDDRPLASFKTEAPQGRRTTPALVRTVKALVVRGFGIEAIADTLNLKDSRVRQLRNMTPETA